MPHAAHLEMGIVMYDFDVTVPCCKGDLGLTHLEPGAAKQIVGDRLVELYGFEREKLDAVAERINAITLRDIAVPRVSDEMAVDRWAIASFHRQGTL